MFSNLRPFGCAKLFHYIHQPSIFLLIPRLLWKQQIMNKGVVLSIGLGLMAVGLGDIHLFIWFIIIRFNGRSFIHFIIHFSFANLGFISNQHIILHIFLSFYSCRTLSLIILKSMGNTCMGNPRKGKEVMKQKHLQNRYKDYDSTKVKKELVAGQIEGEQIKISKNLFVCSICMQNYNLTKREPVVVCGNHHTYCRQCVQSASAYNKKCPQCRSDFLPLLRNRDIYQLVEDNLRQLEQDKLPVIKEQSNYLVLSVDQKNKFIDNFWIQGNRIMKIDSNLIWEGFLSNETILRDRQCMFSVKVIQSKFNNIEIGVVGKGYRLQKNVTCKQSVVYHLADGMILEGIPGRNSEWRAKGKKIQVGKQISIQVRVNIPSKTIGWWQNDKELGSARLSDHILQHECVAYILMSHKQDIIELNG